MKFLKKNVTLLTEIYLCLIPLVFCLLKGVNLFTYALITAPFAILLLSYSIVSARQQKRWIIGQVQGIFSAVLVILLFPVLFFKLPDHSGFFFILSAFLFFSSIALLFLSILLIFISLIFKK